MKCGIIKKITEAEGEGAGWLVIESLKGGELAGIYGGGNDTHREQHQM